MEATINNLIAEDEAATALGIGKDTLFRLRKESKIRFYRIRNRVMFSPEQIKSFWRTQSSRLVVGKTPSDRRALRN